MKTLQEVEEDTRRRRSIAAGFAAGLGTAGHQLYSAQDAFVKSPEARQQARAGAMALARGGREYLAPIQDALLAAKEKVKSTTPYMAEMADLKQYQGSLIDEGIRLSLKETPENIAHYRDVIRPDVQGIDDEIRRLKKELGRAMRSGTKEEFHNLRRGTKRVAEAVNKARNPESLRTISGLRNYMTPQVAAKALAASLLAGGAYYGGSKLLSPNYEDYEG
jgi:uncharacterized protein YaaR (DUF327 family)